jgi:hypothetical protein
MKYRNRIPEPGTTISGFADNKKKIKKKSRPTDPRFFVQYFYTSGEKIFGYEYNSHVTKIRIAYG